MSTNTTHNTALDDLIASSGNSLVSQAKHTFPGGIFPDENKHQSMQLPVTDISVAPELVFPLSQHMGVPAEPIIEVGEKVLGGQKIADAVGVFSAAIHASSSGIVSAIEERTLPHPSGMSGLCIIIKTDGLDQQIEFVGNQDYQTLSPEELSHCR